MPSPSMPVTNCGNEFSRASTARQSNLSSQYPARSRTRAEVMP